jgi:hypothetical protein
VDEKPVSLVVAARDIIGVHPVSLRRRLKRPDRDGLPAPITIGGRMYFYRSEILAWLESRRTK